jgi:hypothetical protein
MARTIRTPGAAAAAADDTPADAAAAQPALDDGLPNAIDIDPKAITGPVLTRQGWVCPAEAPRPPLR